MVVKDKNIANEGKHMRGDRLAKGLKILVVLIGLCGLLFYGGALPLLGKNIVLQIKNQFFFWPWLAFMWTTAAPCYIVLFFLWKIANIIAQGRGLSEKTAQYLKHIAMLAAFTALWFLAGNCLLLFLKMSHTVVFILSLTLIIFGILVAVAALRASCFVRKHSAAGQGKRMLSAEISEKVR